MPGRIVTSGASTTSASIQVVAGSMTVTPSRIQRVEDPAVQLAAEAGELGAVVGALGLHHVVDR